MRETDKFRKIIKANPQNENAILDDNKPLPPAKEQTEDRTVILSKIQFLIEYAYQASESSTKDSNL